MVTEDDRYHAEGLLSFVKGCRRFSFGSCNSTSCLLPTGGLLQTTDNPSVYTKLSCYLPWIAEAYGMTLASGYATGCRGVSGDREDAEKDECIARNQEMCKFGAGVTLAMLVLNTLN